MKYSLLIIVATLLLLASGLFNPALAGGYKFRCRYARWYPWHAGYYNVSWGMPVALVVPPTAEVQTNWGWGVGNTRVTPICHQFGRDWPGVGYYDRGMFKPTPHWPSDTQQFGINYIRGPW